VAYPLWTDLTEKQRKGFKDSLAATGVPLDKTTALQHNAALKTVADSMMQEGRALPPGKTNADLAAARLKESESKAKERAQEEIERGLDIERVYKLTQDEAKRRQDEAAKKREQNEAEQKQEKKPEKIKDEDIPDYLGENPFAKPSTMTDEQEAKFDADFAKYKREEENKNKIPNNVVEQIVLEILEQIDFVGLVQRLRVSVGRLLLAAVEYGRIETNAEYQIAGIHVGINATNLRTMNCRDSKVDIIHCNILFQQSFWVNLNANNPL
jgi:hypothetical protein